MLPVLHQDEAVAAADLQPPGGCWLQAGAGQSLGLQDAVADGYFKMLFILVRQVYRGPRVEIPEGSGFRLQGLQATKCSTSASRRLLRFEGLAVWGRVRRF